MKNLSLLAKMAVSSALAAGLTSALAAGCAPKCRAKCAAYSSKCSAKCSAKCGPKCGAKVNTKLIQRPAGYKPNYPVTPATVAAGELVFKNTKLSTNGMACATCHTGGGGFQKSFAMPFPHKVEMASGTYDLNSIQLDEAIQMCMVGPMAAKPFNWKSPDLANLVAFMSEEQKKFAKK
jgi:cytochrome c peroxidase